MRTNIQMAALERPLHTLLVTSSDPDEGKSTTLANLAVTLAQAEQRVILVDCDLRRPALHTLFGVTNEAGLTTLLVDKAPKITLQPTGVDGLRLLTAGPTTLRPSDVLGSRRMDALIERLKSEADIVLFDAPPITAATDALVLATKLDGVLLVAQSGKTRRDRARNAVQSLQKVHVHVVGVVLTNAKLEKGSYGAY